MNISAYLVLHDLALHELRQAGINPVQVPLGDQAAALAWAEDWAGEVAQRVDLMATFSAGADARRSTHLLVSAVLQEPWPSLGDDALWIGFAQHLALRLAPVRVVIEPTSQRPALLWREVLADELPPRLVERADHLATLAQRALPALARALEVRDRQSPEADQAALGLEAAESACRAMATLGALE